MSLPRLATAETAADPNGMAPVLPIGDANCGVAGTTFLAPIPTIDGEAWLALEIIWPEIWPAAHNRELWGTGPDGRYGWRDQADGVYE